MQKRAIYCCRLHKKSSAAKRHRERNPGYYGRLNKKPARAAYLATYAEKNRTRIRAYAREQQRRYRAEHPGAALCWARDNKLRRNLLENNRRARKLNNPGSVGISAKDWLRMVNVVYRDRCVYCGVGGDMQMDHVIPLARGGRHAIGNVVPACRPCNTSKHSRLLADWRYRP